MTDIARLGLQIDSSSAVLAKDALDRLTTSGAQTEKKFDGVTTASQRMQAQIDATLAPLRALYGLLGGIGAALAIQKILDYADAWKLVEGRLSIVTKSHQELIDTETKLFDLSQKVRTGYEATAELYARVARNAENYNLTQEKVLRVTETVTKATVVSGASAQEAEAGIRQFSQALASGTLRGDEFRSVMENMPRLARAIAEGMGASYSQLRQLSQEGKLSGDAIINALLKQGAAIDAEFKKIPVTVGQAFVVLDNAVGKYIFNFDKAEGATSALSASIVEMASHIDLIVELGTAIAGLLIIQRIGPLIGAAAAATTSYAVSSASLYSAVLSGNAVMLNGVKAAEAKAIADRNAAAASLEVAAAERARVVAVVASIEAEIAAQVAIRRSLGGGVNLNDPSAFMRKEVQASRDLAAAKALLATTNNTVTAAEARLTVATVAQTEAMAAATFGSRVLAASLTTLRTVMNFLGGPAGLIMIAAAAIYYFATSLSAAEIEAKKLSKTNADLDESIRSGTIASKEAAAVKLREAEASAAVTKSKIEEAVAELNLQKARLNDPTSLAFGSEGQASYTASQIKKIQDALDDLNVEYDQANLNITNLRRLLNESGEGGDKNGETATSKAITKVTEALQFQIEQLGRNKREQAIYAELKKAGTTADTDAGKKIVELAGHYYDLSVSTGKVNVAKKDLIAQTRAETADTLALAKAYSGTNEQITQAEAKLKAHQKALEDSRVNEEKYTAALVEQANAEAHLQAVRDLRTSKLNTDLARQRSEAAQLNDPTARHNAELAIERQERLNEVTILYKDNIDDIQKAMNEFDLTQAYDDQTRYWKEVREMAASAADDVAHFLVDGFVNAEKGGRSAFENMWDSVLAGAKRTVANIAAEFLKQQILLPVITEIVGSNSSLLGIVGAAGGTGSGVSGGSSGSGGLGGLSSLSNLSSLASMFSSDGLIAQGANWASGVLGYGSIFGSGVTATAAAQAAGTVGAHAAPYVAGSATSAATGAAGASTGAAGGLSAGLSAIPVWGWVAMAVMAAKQFTMGADPTSAKGTLNTLLMPSHEEWASNPRRAIANLDPVGLALTDHGLPAFLTPGGMINKLLGNSKPSNEGVAYVTEGMGAVSKPYYDPSEYNNANDNASYELISAFAKLRDEIISVTGGTFDKKVLVNVGSRDGVNSSVGTEKSRDSNLEDALDFLVKSLAKGITGVVDEDYKRILAMGGSAEDLYTNLSIAKQIKEIGQSTDLKDAQESLAAIVKDFADLTKRAHELGLATVELEKAQKSQIVDMGKNLKVNFASTVKDFIGQFLDPLMQLQAAISTDGRTTYEKFTDAQALFRDVATKAQQGNQVALGLLSEAGATYADLARNLSSSTKPLRDFLDSLNSGSLSKLTPVEQLAAARGKFDDLAGKAQAGDTTVISDLQAAAQSYLEMARAYGASGQLYQDAYADVTSIVSSIIAQIDGAIGTVDSTSVLNEINAIISPLITELNNNQIEILAGIRPTLDDLNDNFREEIAVLKDQGDQTRILLAEIATALAGVGHSSGGLIRKFAGGGAVFGFGGPTTDDVPARLADGEYVNKASSVSRFGVGFFDALNAGVNPTQRTANDNSDVVEAIRASTTVLSQELRDLREENAEMREEMTGLRQAVENSNDRGNALKRKNG